MPAYNATVDNVPTWDGAHPAYIDLCVASVLAIALRSLTITYNLPTNCSIGFLMNYDVGTSSSHASDVVLRNIHFHICAGSDPSHVSNIALGAPGEAWQDCYQPLGSEYPDWGTNLDWDKCGVVSNTSETSVCSDTCTQRAVNIHRYQKHWISKYTRAQSDAMWSNRELWVVWVFVASSLSVW